MKAVATQKRAERERLLRALRDAVVEGATWRYEALVSMAVEAGATDEEIDAVAHSVLETLLQGAEQPLTARQLANEW